MRKFLGSVTKYGYLKIVQRWDPLGQQGVEYLRGGGASEPPPPPPKSAPGYIENRVEVELTYNLSSKIIIQGMKLEYKVAANGRNVNFQIMLITSVELPERKQ